MEIIEEYFDCIHALRYYNGVEKYYKYFYADREHDRSGILNMSNESYLTSIELTTREGKITTITSRCPSFRYFCQKYEIKNVKKILNLIGG